MGACLILRRVEIQPQCRRTRVMSPRHFWICLVVLRSTDLSLSFCTHASAHSHDPRKQPWIRLGDAETSGHGNEGPTLTKTGGSAEEVVPHTAVMVLQIKMGEKKSSREERKRSKRSQSKGFY